MTRVLLSNLICRQMKIIIKRTLDFDAMIKLISKSNHHLFMSKAKYSYEYVSNSESVFNPINDTPPVSSPSQNSNLHINFVFTP